MNKIIIVLSAVLLMNTGFAYDINSFLSEAPKLEEGFSANFQSKSMIITPNSVNTDTFYNGLSCHMAYYNNGCFVVTYYDTRKQEVYVSGNLVGWNDYWSIQNFGGVDYVRYDYIDCFILTRGQTQFIISK